ncbi:MAG: Rieske 2Fe-2S domain-containing protein [Pseudomonadota bacterium]
MLTAEENERLCRVEGDAPMGQLMRRHWIPALLIEEVPDVDGAPVAVRLFGENLVAWRDSDGKVGLMDRYCPHRRASLQFGRNEDGGLRCLYHGWKVNVSGAITEMPSEPPASCQARKVQQKTYPTHEHGGLVWAYMGPAETFLPFAPPPFAPSADTKVSIAKIIIDCNWAQILEGAIDSAHSSSLHSTDITPSRGDRTKTTSTLMLRPTTDKAPRIQVKPTPYGMKYVAIRRPIQNAATQDYVRMTLFVAPFTVMIPPNSVYGLANVNVPVDDTHTAFYFIAWTEGEQVGIGPEEWRKFLAAEVGPDLDPAYSKLRNLGNGYLQDREAMKNGSFTGIRGIPNQDIVMWETMGPIADRTTELLGASDQAIVAFRGVMMNALKNFASGQPAIGSPPEVRNQQSSLRSFEGMLPKGSNWEHLDTLQGQRELATPEVQAPVVV